MILTLNAGIVVRIAIALFILAGVFSLGISDSRAQDAPQPADAAKPADAAPKAELPKDYRGSGNYLSVIKIIACWLVFLLWIKTTDWANTDSQEYKLDYHRWNPIIFGTFFGAFLLMWIIPLFWIAFPLLLIAYAAPLTVYIVQRNAKLEHNQRVLTAEHLRFLSATHLNKLGMKIQAEKADPHESGPPVKAFAHGGPDEATNNARLLMARQSLGLTMAREILAESLAGRASSIMIDFTAQGATIRTMVDGVWIPRETRARDVADPAQESLKLLCGLNPQDRQSRQEGTFAVEYESARLAATFASQGTSTGERILIQFEEKKIHFKALEELGMRAKLKEELQQSLGTKQGYVLLSAPPSNGLRTTTDVAINTCDRFTREFAAVEEENNRYEEVENVPVTTYKAADGQTPIDILPKFFRTEPDVAVIRDPIDAETIALMCEEIEDNRLMISTIRSKDSAEGLLRVLALGVSPTEFAKAVTAVVSQRLVRKLCEGCKEAYAPTPQVLQQLGIPEGRVQAFYRPPQPGSEEQRDREPCEKCGGIGYYGRTAIFELLTVGDAVRRVLAENPKLESLRKAARKDGMKSLQEEGVLLVAKGVTSLPELMRVLKQ